MERARDRLGFTGEKKEIYCYIFLGHGLSLTCNLYGSASSVNYWVISIRLSGLGAQFSVSNLYAERYCPITLINHSLMVMLLITAFVCNFITDFKYSVTKQLSSCHTVISPVKEVIYQKYFFSL